MKFQWFLFLLAPLLVLQTLKSEIVNDRHFPSIETDELLLSNGWRVVCKKTGENEDEILIYVSALGGFAAVPPEQRASAELAAEIAWESGIGTISADQLTVLLYQNSIEFDPEILPFSRAITISCSNASLELSFKLVNLFFTQSKFTKKGFDKVIKETAESLRKPQDREVRFEEEFRYQISGRNPALLPLNAKDMAKLNLEHSQDFFDKAFGDPSQFTSVIVGDFDRAKIDELANKYLAVIPAKKVFQFSSPALPVSPNVRDHLLKLPAFPLSRVAAPVRLEINEQNMHAFEFTCQVIETRLRNVFKNRFGETLGVDISYEFPFYPYLNMPWVIIQFDPSQNSIKAATETILSAIGKLVESGPTMEEMNAAREQLIRNEDFWVRQDSFWLYTLANYSLWRWNLSNVLGNFSDKNLFIKKTIEEILINNILFKDYILFTKQ